MLPDKFRLCWALVFVLSICTITSKETLTQLQCAILYGIATSQDYSKYFQFIILMYLRYASKISNIVTDVNIQHEHENDKMSRVLAATKLRIDN